MLDLNSKMSLKLSCLKACDNNIEKAKELYCFLAEGLQDLPETDPIKPNTFEQVKTGASELLGWFSSHKDEIAQGIALFQSIKGTPTPVNTNIPPIPKL